VSARVVTIMNQKGGVGKTTTVINLGAALAELGRRVLLVDMDPQANLTRGLGVSHEEVSAGRSIYDVITDQKAGLAGAVRRTAWPRLDLVPSHIDLSGAEIEMVSMYGRELRMRRALGDVPEHYDYVLIDCLPSLSLITVNAMAAAQEIFVPMQAHPFALEGLGKLFSVVDLVRAEINPGLELTAVIVNMYDSRTKVSQSVMDELLAHPRLTGKVLRTVIRQNIKIAESQGAGQPVIHFDRHCHGAVAYRVLAEEVDAMRPAPRPAAPPEAEPATETAGRIPAPLRLRAETPVPEELPGVRTVPVERIELPGPEPRPRPERRPEREPPAAPAPPPPPTAPFSAPPASRPPVPAPELLPPV
jgi:chromosome partitioning protein